jgi:opacity protein-like surface antigen
MRCLAVVAAVLATCSVAGMASAQDKPSGPYLRLDTGASFTTAGNHSFGSRDQGESYVVGGGVGYRFMPQLRADFTLGSRGDYGSRRTVAFATVQSDLESLVGLATAYYDIVTIGGFTPYIGAGVGFADNHASHARITIPFGTSSSLAGHTNTDFAWQATSGVSYSITPSLALDIGYRYVDMGTVQTGSLSAMTVPVGGFITGTGAGGSSTAVGVGVAKTDLQAHEVSIGLRFTF